MFVNLLLLAAAFGKYTSAAIISVGIGGDIQAALNNATANDIISLANGTYLVSSPLLITTPNVSIVGVTGSQINFPFSSDECIIKSSALGISLVNVAIMDNQTSNLCPLNTPWALRANFSVNLINPAITNNTLNIDLDVGAMYSTRTVENLYFGNCSWKASTLVYGRYLCYRVASCTVRVGFRIPFNKIRNCGVTKTQTAQFNIYTTLVEAKFTEYVSMINATEYLRLPGTRTANGITKLRINIDRVRLVVATTMVEYGEFIPDCVLVALYPRTPPDPSTMIVNCTVDPPVVPPGKPSPPPPPPTCIGGNCGCQGATCPVCSGTDCLFCTNTFCSICPVGPSSPLCMGCMGAGCTACTGNRCPNPTCVGVDCPCFGTNCKKPVCGYNDTCITCNGTSCNVCVGSNCTVCTGVACPACTGSDCPNPVCAPNDLSCPCVGSACPVPICDGTTCYTCNGTACLVCANKTCDICTGTNCTSCKGSLCPNPTCVGDCLCMGTGCSPPTSCSGGQCSTCNGTACKFCKPGGVCLTCNGTACPFCRGNACPNPTCTHLNCACFGTDCPITICKAGTCTTCSNTSCLICNNTSCTSCAGSACPACTGQQCPNPTCSGSSCPCYGTDCSGASKCNITTTSIGTNVTDCEAGLPECNNLVTGQLCNQTYTINMTSCNLTGYYYLNNIAMKCQQSSITAGSCPFISPGGVFPTVQVFLRSEDYCVHHTINISNSFELDIIPRVDATYTGVRVNASYLMGDQSYWSIRIWTNSTSVSIKEADIIAAMRTSDGDCSANNFDQYFSIIGNVPNSELTYVTHLNTVPPMINFNLPINSRMACTVLNQDENNINFTYTVQVDYVDGFLRRRRRDIPLNLLDLDRPRRKIDSADVGAQSTIKQREDSHDTNHGEAAYSYVTSVPMWIAVSGSVVILLFCLCCCGVVGLLVLRRRKRKQKQKACEQTNQSQVYVTNSRYSLSSGSHDTGIEHGMLATYPNMKYISGM